MDRQATSRIQPTTVVWPDTIDEILAGDCVVMLAYVTMGAPLKYLITA